MDTDALAALQTPAGEALLTEVANLGVGDHELIGTVTALRQRHPAPLVSAAVTQVQLRQRACAKFGDDAQVMFFTPDGVEQATRRPVAGHRAKRFAAARQVVDLCCGVGGDLIEFARAGLTAHGIDRDPLTAAVASANVSALGLVDATVACDDVQRLPLRGWPAAFCDPARRSGGRRIFNPRDYSPPLSFIEELAAAVPMTGAKVGPGIPHEMIPADAEAEWVSDSGELKETALWFGPLATARRRATLLPSGATITGDGAAGDAGPLGSWLHEPDPAVIRAGLVADAADLVGGQLIDPSIAYITSDRLVPSDFTRTYRIDDVLPFSVKRLREALRSQHVGVAAIKKRGLAIEPARLRRDLRLSGDEETTVVLTRVGSRPIAILCTPVLPSWPQLSP